MGNKGIRSIGSIFLYSLPRTSKFTSRFGNVLSLANHPHRGSRATSGCLFGFEGQIGGPWFQPLRFQMPRKKQFYSRNCSLYIYILYIYMYILIYASLVILVQAHVSGNISSQICQSRPSPCPLPLRRESGQSHGAIMISGRPPT